MSVGNRFSELVKPLRNDPAHRARTDLFRIAIEDALRLAEIRQESGLTQNDIAQVLNLSRKEIARVENGQELYLEALAGYVEALGGHLEVRAVLPPRSVEIINGQHDMIPERAPVRTRPTHPGRITRHPRIVARNGSNGRRPTT